MKELYKVCTSCKIVFGLKLPKNVKNPEKRSMNCPLCIGGKLAHATKKDFDDFEKGKNVGVINLE